MLSFLIIHYCKWMYTIVSLQNTLWQGPKKRIPMSSPTPLRQLPYLLLRHHWYTELLFSYHPLLWTNVHNTENGFINEHTTTMDWKGSLHLPHHHIYYSVTTGSQSCSSFIIHWHQLTLKLNHIIESLLLSPQNSICSKCYERFNSSPTPSNTVVYMKTRNLCCYVPGQVITYTTILHN